jgi:hypothetical protein
VDRSARSARQAFLGGCFDISPRFGGFCAGCPAGLSPDLNTGVVVCCFAVFLAFAMFRSQFEVATASARRPLARQALRRIHPTASIAFDPLASEYPAG